jgi:hypothetical protein
LWQAACTWSNAIRVKVDKLIAQEHFEHLIVFTDQAHGRQVWQWVRKEPGKPTAVRTYHYKPGQSGELLLQKLDNLAFTLEEEEILTLVDVTGRLRSLDVERVTKRFYDRFKTEHSSFLGFIKGIPDKQIEGWYASVMINRLMFLYFIQEKGFLNEDKDYIFEKYVNQKQMGAYYTKEDITEYISQNTIIPFLLDEARKGCAVAFVPDGSVWRLLRDDPDRYIHDAMKWGADKPLPAEIEAGVTDVSKRGGWNRTAPPEFALPTEI